MWWIWVMHAFIAQTEQIASSGWSDRDHNCISKKLTVWSCCLRNSATVQTAPTWWYLPYGDFSFSHISILYLMRISLSVSGVVFCSEFFYNAAQYDEIDSNQPRWINGNHANSFDPWHLAIPDKCACTVWFGGHFLFPPPHQVAYRDWYK